MVSRRALAVAESALATDAENGIYARVLASCVDHLHDQMGVGENHYKENVCDSEMTEEQVSLKALMGVLGPAVSKVVGGTIVNYQNHLAENKKALDTINDNVVKKLRNKINELQNEIDCQYANDTVNAYQQAEVEDVKQSYQAQATMLENTIKNLKLELKEKDVKLDAVDSLMRRKCNELESDLENAREEIADLEEYKSKYQAAMKEVRELHAIIKDLRGNIRIFTRIRPILGSNHQSVIQYDEDESSLRIYSEKHSKWFPFKFDRVFGESSSQETVYMEAKSLIHSIMDGSRVCIFAYGQTGSGKTHTMSYLNRRSLEDLFQIRQHYYSNGIESCSFKVQLLEVYNEQIYDLLSSDPQKSSLKIQATRGSGCNVPDATHVNVCGAEDVYHVLEIGSKNRSIGATQMNSRSSRSHQILTIMMTVYDTHTDTVKHTGILHLVDLAGSERLDKSNAQGERLTETRHINTSLSALCHVMKALAEKRSHIPFRDSKLTQLLRDSLSGESKSMMFMHVAPEEGCMLETLSTLQFGNSVTEITLK